MVDGGARAAEPVLLVEDLGQLPALGEPPPPSWPEYGARDSRCGRAKLTMRSAAARIRPMLAGLWPLVQCTNGKAFYKESVTLPPSISARWCRSHWGSGLLPSLAQDDMLRSFSALLRADTPTAVARPCSWPSPMTALERFALAGVAAACAAQAAAPGRGVRARPHLQRAWPAGSRGVGLGPVTWDDVRRRASGGGWLGAPLRTHVRHADSWHSCWRGTLDLVSMEREAASSRPATIDRNAGRAARAVSPRRCRTTQGSRRRLCPRPALTPGSMPIPSPAISGCPPRPTTRNTPPPFCRTSLPRNTRCGSERMDQPPLDPAVGTRRAIV